MNMFGWLRKKKESTTGSSYLSIPEIHEELQRIFPESPDYVIEGLKYGIIGLKESLRYTSTVENLNEFASQIKPPTMSIIKQLIDELPSVSRKATLPRMYYDHRLHHNDMYPCEIFWPDYPIVMIGIFNDPLPEYNLPPMFDQILHEDCFYMDYFKELHQTLGAVFLPNSVEARVMFMIFRNQYHKAHNLERHARLVRQKRAEVLKNHRAELVDAINEYDKQKGQ